MLTIGLYGIRDIHDGDKPYFVHDHAITLMRNGHVLSNIALERFTGRKHDQRLGQFITSILNKSKLGDEPIRFVSVNHFIGDYFESDDGRLRIEPTEEPTIEKILTPAKVLWHHNGRLREYPGWIMCHEFAHIASALPFGAKLKDDTLLAHIDGGASRSACSFWYIQDGKPILLHSAWDDLKDPLNNFNVGLLGRTILGLSLDEHLAMPGKLMGFSAYGKLDRNWLDYLRRKRFYLDESWTQASMLKDLSEKLGYPINFSDLHSPITQMFAVCIQKDFEEKIVETILKFKNMINAKYLIYSGGAALNILTNTLLEKEFGFGNVFIPPCASDSGLALGGAAWIEYLDYGQIPMHDPFLNRFDVPTSLPSLEVIPQVAKAIHQGEVVALCLNGSEIGPRALGHRSILARADDITLRQHVSENIKKREWYRPLAPVMLAEIAKKSLFEPASLSKLGPYMLGSYTLHDEWINQFSGVAHTDNSVRAQIVHPSEKNQFLYNLLNVLNQNYGIVSVINTSFNIRGEPILHDHNQAISAITQMNIDKVVIHGSLHSAQ